MQSDQINELAKALASAQGVMKAAKYNRVNPHFKSQYADLAAVWDAIREPLTKNGLSVTQEMEGNGNGGLYLNTVLRHSSGQWISSIYPLPVGTPQQFGSALTYARRYSLSAITGVASDEDDDANAAQEAKPAAAKKKLSTEMKDSIPDQKPEPYTPTPELSLEDMAREAASRGRNVFMTFYNKRTPEEQQKLKSIGTEITALYPKHEA